MAESFDELVALERSAESERAKLADLSREAYDAQLGRWREASLAVQAGIAAHAAVTGFSRNDIEQAVSEAVQYEQGSADIE